VAEQRIITLFEHQRQSYDALGIADNHPALARIEQLNEKHHVEMLRVGRRHLSATHYVGVWRVGGLVVQVLPKIDYAAPSQTVPQPGTPAFGAAVSSATQNFLRMLAIAGELRVVEQNLAQLATTRHDWLELLTRLFAAELHGQLKQGLERQYTSQEADLAVIRGRWLLQQQLAHRPHVRHRFNVAYDEFRENTALNQVFRHTVERLLPRTRQPGTRQLLADIAEWLRDVNLLPEVGRERLERVVFTRLNQRFQPAFNLARLFLENRAFQLASGRQELSAFTFEMWRLFEAFIGRLLRDQRSAVLPAEWAQARVRLQAQGRRLHLARRLNDDVPSSPWSRTPSLKRPTAACLPCWIPSTSGSTSSNAAWAWTLATCTRCWPTLSA
jgi:5-methylcytosine-specific restriction endonuclease McrBC regulatory subunit McrC